MAAAPPLSSPAPNLTSRSLAAAADIFASSYPWTDPLSTALPFDSCTRETLGNSNLHSSFVHQDQLWAASQPAFKLGQTVESQRRKTTPVSTDSNSDCTLHQLEGVAQNNRKLDAFQVNQRFPRPTPRSHAHPFLIPRSSATGSSVLHSSKATMDHSELDSQLSSSSVPTPTVSLRSSDAAAALAALGRAFLMGSDSGATGQPAPVPSAEQDPRSSSTLSSFSGSDLGSCVRSGPTPTPDDDSTLPTTMSPSMLMFNAPDLYHHPHCPPYFPPPTTATTIVSAGLPGAVIMPSYLGPNDHSVPPHHLRHVSAGEDFDAFSPMMGTMTGGLRTTSATSGSGMQTPQYGHSNVASPLVLHSHRRGAVSPPALPPSSVFLDAMVRASGSATTNGSSGAPVKGLRRVRVTPGAVSESGSVSSVEAEQQKNSQPPLAVAATEDNRSAIQGPVTRRMAMRQQKPSVPPPQVNTVQEALQTAGQTRRGIRRVTRSFATSDDDHDLSYPSSANTSPNTGAMTIVPSTPTPTAHPHSSDDHLSSSSEDNNDDDDDVFTDPESTPNRRRAAARSSSSRRTPRVSITAPGISTTAATGDARPLTDLASALNDRLSHLESIIDLTALSAPPHMRDFSAQRRAFKATVNAVSAIVAEKLYKCRDMSLEDYFRTKFRISRAQVYRVVDSATVLRDLEELETTWEYARNLGHGARAGGSAAAGEGRDAGNDDMPSAPQPALFPLPVKQRVCAAIKSCAGNKQDRQELWKTLCMRVAPQAASSKDVKETWDWLVAQGRVTPKNGRRGSTVPPDLGDVMAAAASASADSSDAAANARMTHVLMPPAVMPPPRTKRSGNSRKRSAAAAATVSVEAPAIVGQSSDESVNPPAAVQQPQPAAVATNPSDVIELPPPAKRLRRSASMTAAHAITAPTASNASQSSIATPPRAKPKGTRRRPVSLAPPVAEQHEEQPPLTNLVPALASPRLSPTAPTPSMSTLESLQSLGSPMGSPIDLQLSASPAVGPGMVTAPKAIRPGHYLSLPTGNVSPSHSNPCFSASGSPTFYHPQTRSPSSVAPVNLFVTSPSISPSSLTVSAPLSPVQFVTTPMMFTSAPSSMSTSSSSGAIPATLTGGPIKGAYASLIETAISTLQQLQDAGIQLEPCFNGTWVSGINQFRFRKHGEFVSAVHPHSATTMPASGASNLLGLHRTSGGGSPMLSMPGNTSVPPAMFSPAPSSSHIPSITIPADGIAPAAMTTSFKSSPSANGARAASAGGMATAASPSVVQQHEAAMRLARLAAAAAAATTPESVVTTGGKLGRSDSLWSTASPGTAPGTGSPMQVSPRVGSGASSGELGATQSR